MMHPEQSSSSSSSIATSSRIHASNTETSSCRFSMTQSIKQAGLYREPFERKNRPRCGFRACLGLLCSWSKQAPQYRYTSSLRLQEIVTATTAQPRSRPLYLHCLLYQSFWSCRFEVIGKVYLMFLLVYSNCSLRRIRRLISLAFFKWLVRCFRSATRRLILSCTTCWNER
jgi:hypothetical protein